MVSYLEDDLVKLFLGGLKHEVGGPGRSLGEHFSKALSLEESLYFFMFIWIHEAVAGEGEVAVRRFWVGLVWSWL